MKRIPELIPLSHDHQHGLSATLRLRRVADAVDALLVNKVPGGGGPDADDAGAMVIAEAGAALIVEVRAFLQFARRELFAHFAEEEHALLPQCVSHLVELKAGIARLAVEHAQIRHELDQLACVFGEEPDDVAAIAVVAGRVAALLHDHIRWEEREFFPRVEQTLTTSDLAGIALTPRSVPDWAGELPYLNLRDPVVVDGVAAGLNATPIDLAAHELRAAWTATRDIMLVVLHGDLVLEIDGVSGALAAPAVVIVPAGSSRQLRAGARGALLLSVHGSVPPLNP